MASENYPLGKKAKIIGTPYQGTHAVKFNEAGGSNNWESENAYDLAVPVGTPVYAVANGTIGSQIGSLGQGGRFAGLRVHLVTSGNEYYYAHLSRLVVHAGEVVKAGQLLGYSGAANGVAHLHFAAEHGDPMSAWGGAAGPDASAPTGATPPPTQTTPPTGSQQTPQAPPPDLTPQFADPTPIISFGGVTSPNRASTAWNDIMQQPNLSPETMSLFQKITSDPFS